MEFKKLQDENFKMFTHKSCEYFPCHPISDSSYFNCLFCYCPLYTLGDQCGGDFSYEGDVKDCSKCLLPHSEGGYSYIMKMFGEVAALASKNRKQKNPEASSAVKRAFIKIL